jgi:hypothetical protein
VGCKGVGGKPNHQQRSAAGRIAGQSRFEALGQGINGPESTYENILETLDNEIGAELCLRASP